MENHSNQNQSSFFSGFPFDTRCAFTSLPCLENDDQHHGRLRSQSSVMSDDEFEKVLAFQNHGVNPDCHTSVLPIKSESFPAAQRCKFVEKMTFNDATTDDVGCFSSKNASRYSTHVPLMKPKCALLHLPSNLRIPVIVEQIPHPSTSTPPYEQSIEGNILQNHNITKVRRHFLCHLDTVSGSFSKHGLKRPFFHNGINFQKGDLLWQMNHPQSLRPTVVAMTNPQNCPTEKIVEF